MLPASELKSGTSFKILQLMIARLQPTTLSTGSAILRYMNRTSTSSNQKSKSFHRQEPSLTSKRLEAATQNNYSSPCASETKSQATSKKTNTFIWSMRSFTPCVKHTNSMPAENIGDYFKSMNSLTMTSMTKMNWSNAGSPLL